MSTEMDKTAGEVLAELMRVARAALKSAVDVSPDSGISVIVDYFDDCGADDDDARYWVRQWRKRESHKITCVLLSMEELREKGLISGGPSVDVAGLTKLKAEGDKAGFPGPTNSEILEIVDYFRACGEWEMSSDD